MEFKKKLKQRLHIAYVYIALGIILIGISFLVKSNNSFISSFGFVIIIMGLVRIRNYRIITKSEESIRKQEIAESDERTITIINKAKSAAFATCIMLFCVASIVLSFLGMHELSKWMGIPVCVLVVLYLIFYFVYQKKL